jgi:O-antigen/teichoic acid export membrane protein
MDGGRRGILAARKVALGGRTLRGHAARGTIINAAFSVGTNTLTLIRGFVVASFLTAQDYGVWGIIIVALGTLTWLKQVGVSDKYIQQDDEDEETAFQKAFTLELIANGVMMILLLAAIPIAVASYGQSQIVGPALVVVAVIPAYVLQTPVWVFYRRMDFLRQRTLQVLDPCVGFVVAIILAVAGAGYWAFPISMFLGAWANAIFVMRNAPYPLRLRFDWKTTREYATFSWPLFVQSAGGVVLAQGVTILASRRLGLAAVGAINLAASLSVYTHRVDSILTQTLYPAICAVKDRLDLLAEAFVKSNRLTLMWGIPVGIGTALFVSDLVHFVLGEQWAFAITVMQTMAIAAAMEHIGFNWLAFFRARGDTRPVAVTTILNLITFGVIPVPLLITHGLDGYAYGMLAAAAVQLMARGFFLARLFKGFQMTRHILRAIAPTVPAVAVVLAVRAVEPMHRTLPLAAGELVLYLVTTIAATWLLERDLLREAVGYVRARADDSLAVQAAPVPA